MLFLVITIIFFATVIRSAFGFGEALIAVPLLALMMPIEVAAPIAVLVSITVAVMAMVQDWQHIRHRSASILVLSSFVGIPLGLWLLSSVSEQIVKTILAIVIISFSSFILLNRSKSRLKTKRSAPLFGFVAGILGGAYGMNGPPLVAYGTLRHWPPQEFRATLQAYFFPASIVVMIGYWINDLWTPSVTRYYLLSLPAVILAVILGRILNRRLHAHTFITCVHIGLVLIGMVLLWQASR